MNLSSQNKKTVKLNKYLLNYQNDNKEEVFESEDPNSKLESQQSFLRLSATKQQIQPQQSVIISPKGQSPSNIQQLLNTQQELQNSLIKQSQLLDQNNELKQSMSSQQQLIKSLQQELNDKDLKDKTKFEVETLQLRKENQILQHQLQQAQEKIAQMQVQIEQSKQLQNTKFQMNVKQQAILDVLVLSNLLLSQKLNIEPINTNIEQITKNIEKIKRDPSLYKYINDYFGVTLCLTQNDMKQVTNKNNIIYNSTVSKCDDEKLQQAVIQLKKQLRLKHIELDLQYKQVSKQTPTVFAWFLYDKIVDLRLVNNKLMIKSGAGLIEFGEYLNLIL